MSGLQLLEAAAGRADVFATLEHQQPDALLGLIALYNADPRPGKIDLGVGVFRDDEGRTPVMRAVKLAEQQLVSEQPTKSYLGSEGDIGYTDLLGELVFGTASDRRVGVQTPGGTGALRLGAEFLARARPDATVWIGNPTWPNHAPIFREAGLDVRLHRFVEPSSAAINFAALIEDVSEAAPGDILLLHGCCQNPTGASFTVAQWAQIADLCDARGLIPFIDLAYQGLGDGLEEDAVATRLLVERLPAALVAYSCDKNFGLYRERVGALWVQGDSSAAAERVRGNVLVLARSLWSMPPDHGAAIVRTILETPALRDDWLAELGEMRVRINQLRHALAATHADLGPIADQRGMFAMLPITPADVTALRERHGIYMAGNGRINIAGLRLDTVAPFVAALAPYLPSARGA